LKGIAKKFLFPFLPQFVTVFTVALQQPDGPTSDSGLKMEILKALTTLVKSFPSRMAEYLPQILDPVWLALTHNAETYPFGLHNLGSLCISAYLFVFVF